MTRLATVLIPVAASIFHGDPTHRGCESCREAVSQGLAAIPEVQREAMERSLDVCGREGCGLIRGHPWHIADHEHGKHSPLPRCHPFVPLGDPS